MEIVHVYTKVRAEFGRQCLFSDQTAELLLDLPPEPNLSLRFVARNPRDQKAQGGWNTSEHQVRSGSVPPENVTVTKIRDISHKTSWSFIYVEAWTFYFSS